MEDHVPEMTFGSTDRQPLLETPGEVQLSLSKIYLISS